MPISCTMADRGGREGWWPLGGGRRVCGGGGGRGETLGIYRGGGADVWDHSGLGPSKKRSFGLRFR